MNYRKNLKNLKRTCTAQMGCSVVTLSPTPASALPLENTETTLKLDLAIQHLVDLRQYPVESHADLLAYFHESLAGHDFHENDGDTILTIINPMQERCLTIELQVQLAQQEKFELIPVLKLQGVCGHPVEVRA